MLLDDWLKTDGSGLDETHVGSFDEDVARAARVAFVGRVGVGKTRLYNELRGWRVSDEARPAPSDLPRVEDFGTTMLIDLPELEPGSVSAEEMAAEVHERVAGSALVLYVLDACQPVGAQDAYWVGGIRALGASVLAVANRIDRSAEDTSRRAQEAARRLACPVVPVSALTGAGLDRLVESAMSLGPEAAVSLGHEMPRARRSAARRRIRKAAGRSLVGGRVAGMAVGLLGQMNQHEQLHRELSILYGRAETEAALRRSGVAVLCASAGLFQAATRLARRLPFHLSIAASLLDALVTVGYGWLLLWLFERGEDEAAWRPSLARPSRVAQRSRHALGGLLRRLPQYRRGRANSRPAATSEGEERLR